MQSTEAQHLYKGATILDDLVPRRVAALAPRSGGGLLTVLSPVGADASGPGRLRRFDPADPILLSTEHAVRWTVHYQERAHPGTGYTSTQLCAPYAVRTHWPHQARHMVVTRLVEHHSTIAAVPVALDELPGPGEPAEIVPGGGKIHYRRLKGGPAVLATGDDVRTHLDGLQAVHDREHRRPLHMPVHDPDMSRCRMCVVHPRELTVLRVTTSRTAHDIGVGDLPDHEYALGPEAAYRRITDFALPARRN